MTAALDRNLFFVREHVGMFKAANNYDILDPGTGEEIIHCREDNLGIFTKILRFTDFKRNTPFDIELRTPAGYLFAPVRQVAPVDRVEKSCQILSLRRSCSASRA